VDASRILILFALFAESYSSADELKKSAEMTLEGIQTVAQPLVTDPSCAGCNLQAPTPPRHNQQCNASSPIPIFQDSAPLPIHLESSFFSTRPQKKDQPGAKGILRYRDAGKPRELAVHIALRGSSRQRICDFRPLEIELISGKDPQVKSEDSIFGPNTKSFKVVTHCFEARGEEANQLVLREYAMYRALEALGGPSFKTRLLSMTYSGEGAHDLGPRLAFLIEPKRNLSERCAATYKKRQNDYLAQFEKDPDYLRLDARERIFTDLSQRLILNNEVYVDTNHNNLLLLSKTQVPLFIALYDFDQSALVRDGTYYPGWKPWNGTWGDYLATNQDPELTLAGKLWNSPDRAWLSAYLKQPFQAKGYNGPKISSEEWKAAALVEMKRILEREAQVIQSLEQVPELKKPTKDLIQQRYREFFSALREVVLAAGGQAVP
jgi:hypothetical protein